MVPKIKHNNSHFLASIHNILYASKFISSPFEALALVIDSISRLTPGHHKTISMDLIISNTNISS